MTYRELLELAAKAHGGLAYVDGLGWIHEAESGDRGAWWNPLKSNGDALRLAVKCRMKIEINERSIVASWNLSEFEAAVPVYEYPDIDTRDGDEIVSGHDEATRRAIVRAAAEIGKGIK
jgi:hypothetical protein